MFSDIAPTYDFLNRAFSLGADRLWRRRAAASLLRGVAGEARPRLLDLAAGTADVALEVRRQAGARARVAGVDFALPMLARGRKKAAKANAALSLVQGDALGLPFRDGVFDGVIVSFGLRNLEDREAGLREMGRVTRAGGRLVVLEFGRPGGLFGLLYAAYFRVLVPLVGRLVSTHPRAYSYLPRTVSEFPGAERLSEMIREAGFGQVRHRPMTGGVVILHEAAREAS